MPGMDTVELLLTNARIVDVFRLRCFDGWLAVQDGRFLYVEEGDPLPDLASSASMDVGGRLLVPGLIDTHMHIESSLVLPHTFAEAVLPHATTAVLADAHEIANVAGEDGVRWFMECAADLPLHVYFAVPSVVPIISAPVETPNATLNVDAIERLCADPRVLSIGEVHDYRGVAAGEKRLLELGELSVRTGLKIEGHIPGLKGTDLSRYVSLGATSDHTLTNPRKLLEELSKGLYIMLQRKSVTRENIETLMSLPDRSRILFVTDDVAPSELRDGHLLQIVRRAIGLGLPPLEAIASSTLRPATYLGLHRLGAIAPGRQADFWLAETLDQLVPLAVYVAGCRVAENGKAIDGAVSGPSLAPVPEDAPPVPGPFGPNDFQLVPASVGRRHAVISAIHLLNTENTLADLAKVEVEVEDGHPMLHTDADLCLIGIVSRVAPHRRSMTLLKGFGLTSGAYASSFAHDAHNLLVAGCDPLSITAAANEVHRLGGGVVFAVGEKIEAALPLPIMGLLSDATLPEVVDAAEAIEDALRAHGASHQRPLLTLTFMALSSSPYYKMSDLGVVDVERREVVSPVIATWETS